MEDYENYMNRVNTIRKYSKKLEGIGKEDKKEEKKENKKEDKKEDQVENQDENENKKKKYFFSEFQWELITAFIGISLALGMTVAIIEAVQKIFK